MKKKDVLFIFQITENYLKVVKCLSSPSRKRTFTDIEKEPLSLGLDDKQLAEKLSKILKKLEYKDDPIIVSLPRSNAALRYLKVPTQLPQEIERMASLQAPRLLPYPADELITGYEVIRIYKEGYSDINLIVAFKNVIERYLSICKELKLATPKILLSSYGLYNLYRFIKPQDRNPVTFLDVDSSQAEAAIINNKTMVFSRSFKVDFSKPHWEELFVDEINKTKDAYLKDTFAKLPDKVVISGPKNIVSMLIEKIGKQISSRIETLSDYDRVNFLNNLSPDILNSDTSFASLFGFGLEGVVESLNLLPVEIKGEILLINQRKQIIQLSLLILGIVVILASATLKNLSNKTEYLSKLKFEIDKISQEVSPLEGIEKKLKFLDSRTRKMISSLEALRGVYQVMPQKITLTNFLYEEDNQVVLRGQTQELESVLELVSNLGKSPIFKDFNIKVSYATKKKTQFGEVIDFKIGCLKK